MRIHPVFVFGFFFLSSNKVLLVYNIPSSFQLCYINTGWDEQLNAVLRRARFSSEERKEMETLGFPT